MMRGPNSGLCRRRGAYNPASEPGGAHEDAGRPSHDAMAHTHAAWTTAPDPRALATCLEQAAARRLNDGDRQALRAALARATRVGPAGDLIVADGRPVGRVLPHGSVVLYRPD